MTPSYCLIPNQKKDASNLIEDFSWVGSLKIAEYSWQNRKRDFEKCNWILIYGKKIKFLENFLVKLPKKFEKSIYKSDLIGVR